tara:strand:- start:16305 stop:17141 length:837 start_codon:yes stop_codon:yes gene_type:complete
MNNSESTLQWVRGLSEYLDFVKDDKSKMFIDFLEQSMYADNPVIDNTNQKGMIEFISILRKFAPNEIFDIFHKYYRLGFDPKALQDAFSRGQVLSKIWLVNELVKIQKNFDMIHVHAGWFGQIRLYLDQMQIKYNKMRVFDIDKTANEVSDKVFNNLLLENYYVKASIADVDNLATLYRTGFEYPITEDKNEKTEADLIINTSAEHFQENWFLKYRNKPQSTDPLFIIQTNNLHSLPEHVNTIHNVEEMIKKYPMSRVEYSGQLELQGYTRYMLIGRI